MRAIELGGFAIERLLGRGGMADVWLGRHHRSGACAAIKVITRQRMDDPRFREGFHREVRAVAGLDHPGVVPIFDAGTVDAGAAARSEGQLTAGSPWMAMVVADQGDLRRLPIPMGWPLLRETLLQILDALAHAHARDVIHRDLKPENVLLQADGSSLRLLLTDFGIAHVIDPDDPQGMSGSGHSAGTPQYMAPEQLRGEWRDFGPWTDLYALGCMAFELAAGAAPYRGRSPTAIAMQHLTGDIPLVEPARPLPAGFVAWVRRLMDRSPRRRYRSAADAAHALSRLDAPTPQALRSALRVAVAGLGQGDAPTMTGSGFDAELALAETGAHTVSGTLATVISAPMPVVVGPPGTAPMPILGADAPPMPETWYFDAPRRPLLRGVGLGLFGVRAMPFVGRDGPRNALWATLGRVRARRRAELAVIVGEEGTGKSALARWFTRRVGEVGAADVVFFRHSAMDATGDGVASGMDAWFRTQGLDGAELVDRIGDMLTARDPARTESIAGVTAPSLARFIRPDADAGARQPSPTERYSAGRSWLSILATERPLVVVYDDLQWCTDTLGFVDWLLDGGFDAPVLLVATMRSDICELDATQGRLARKLMERADVQTLTMGPLTDAEHDEVIEELLGLSTRLSGELRTRCAGNPLLGVQIMTDWVERGALVSTATGYDAVDAAAIEVPDSLEALAHARIDRLLAAMADPAESRVALEVAAALGQAVDEREWRATCAHIGLGPVDALEAALRDAGLAVPGRSGWVFGHGFVRSAIKHASQRAGRWRSVHRACAASVFVGRAPAERRARHLVDAEAWDAAVDALLLAARGLMDASEYGRARDLCLQREAVLDRLDAPPHDLRRAQACPVMFNVARFTARFDEAEAALDRFTGFPLGVEHAALRAELARMRGSMAFVRGQLDLYFEAYRDAIALYRHVGDGRGEARALHGAGWAKIFVGHADEAIDLFERSLAVARPAGLTIDAGWAWHGIASANLHGGRGMDIAHLNAAGAAFDSQRFTTGSATIRMLKAEEARQGGRLVEARAHAEAAVELFRAVQSQLFSLAVLVMTLLDMTEGDEAGAHARASTLLVEPGLDRLARHHRYVICTLLAWTSMRVGDLDGWKTYMAEAEKDTRRRFNHPGIRDALVDMAERFAAAGRAEPARRAWRLAADHFVGVDAAREARCRAGAEGR